MILVVAGGIVARAVRGGEGDGPDIGEIDPADLLDDEAVALVGTAEPSPDCAGDTRSAPPGDLVVLDVVRVVDGCFTVDTEHLPAEDVAARRRELRDDDTVVAAAVTPVPTLYAGPAGDGEDDRRGDQWGLDAIGVPPAPAEPPWPDGSGVTVAVIDTGIDAGHPDLAGAVRARRHYPAEDPERLDPHGHGTHVAGIVAARAGNGGLVGVAPGVTLLDVPAPLRSPEGVLYNEAAQSVASAMEWAVNNGADVVNMSYGFTFDDLAFDPDDPESMEDFEEFTAMAAAVEYAASQGVVMVASSGNNGERRVCEEDEASLEVCTVNVPPLPARLAGVIAVGAVGQDLELASFSSRHAQVDLVAPGADVVSSVPGGERSLDGTSQAAPHVSAAAAIALVVDPSLSPARLHDALVSSARPLGGEERFGDGNPPFGAGAGLLELPALVEALDQVGRGTGDLDRDGPSYTWEQIVASLPAAAELPEGWQALRACPDDPSRCLNVGTSQAAAQLTATRIGAAGFADVLVTRCIDPAGAESRFEVIRDTDEAQFDPGFQEVEIEGWTGYRFLTERTESTGDAVHTVHEDFLRLWRGNAILEVEIELPNDTAPSTDRGARLAEWAGPTIAELG